MNRLTALIGVHLVSTATQVPLALLEWWFYPDHPAWIAFLVATPFFVSAAIVWAWDSGLLDD